MVDYLYRNLRLFFNKDSDPAMAEGRKAAVYYDYDVYLYESARKTGLVFLCAAFTVLSVQQLSDSNKYKLRCQILHKLGMGKKKSEM